MKLFLIFVLAATERVVAAAGTKPPSTKGKGRRSRSPANSGSRSAGAGSRERKPNNPKAKAKRSSRSSSRGASVASSRSSSSGVHIEEEVASLEKTFREIAKEMVLATTQGRGPAKDRRTVLVVFSDGSSDSEQDSSDGSSGGSSDRSRDRRQDRTGAVASYAVYAQSYEIKRQRVPDDDDYETDGFLNDSGYVLDLKNTECGGRPCKFVVSLATSKAVNDDARLGSTSTFVTAQKTHSLAELLTRTETALVESFRFDNPSEKVASTLAAQYQLAKLFREMFFQDNRWRHEVLYNTKLSTGQKEFSKAVKDFHPKLLLDAGFSSMNMKQADFVSIREFFLPSHVDFGRSTTDPSRSRSRSASSESVRSSARETKPDQGPSTSYPAIFKRRQEGSSLELSSVAELRGVALAVAVFARHVRGRGTSTLMEGLPLDHIVFACDNKLALEEIRFGWRNAAKRSSGPMKPAFAVPHELVQQVVEHLAFLAQEHGDAFYRFAWQRAGHERKHLSSEEKFFYASAQRVADAGARLFRKAVESPEWALAVPERSRDNLGVANAFRETFLCMSEDRLQTGIVAGLAFFKRNSGQKAMGTTNLFTLGAGVDPDPVAAAELCVGSCVSGSRVALATLSSFGDACRDGRPATWFQEELGKPATAAAFPHSLSTIQSEVGAPSSSVDVGNLCDVADAEPVLRRNRGDPEITIARARDPRGRSATRPGGAPRATGLPRHRLGPVPENVQTWPQVVGYTPQPPLSQFLVPVVYPDGSMYTGFFWDGKRHGWGRLMSPDGRVQYDGEWCGGKRHGSGVGTYTDGSKYNGKWQDDKLHGWGTLMSPDGRVKYAGEWSGGKLHGSGVYTYKDGSTYNGEWQDDKRHGHGVNEYPDRSRYNGKWQDDKKHGQGLHTYPDGSTYSGEWLNDKRSGQGLHTYAGGTTYSGEWLNNKRNGQGLYTHADGSTYSGEWRDAKRHGQGVNKYPDGSTYSGGWLNDKRSGQGVHTYAGGTTYSGEWLDDHRHGQGLYTETNGRT